jgi:DNA-directed RNA polymerase omega subunit
MSLEARNLAIRWIVSLFESPDGGAESCVVWAEPVSDTLQAFTLAPPVASRFLFVNVAALRTRQLRRGAMLRLETSDRERVTSAKPERLAMEEIRRGLVSYHLPE